MFKSTFFEQMNNPFVSRCNWCGLGKLELQMLGYI